MTTEEISKEIGTAFVGLALSASDRMRIYEDVMARYSAASQNPQMFWHRLHLNRKTVAWGGALAGGLALAALGYAATRPRAKHHGLAAVTPA